MEETSILRKVCTLDLHYMYSERSLLYCSFTTFRSFKLAI